MLENKEYAVPLEAKNTIAEITYKDALTGLRTGATCEEALDGVTRGMEEGDRDFAFALLDVNKTRHINELYGRDKGDEYLKASSALICYTFKHSPIFRLGGDEFLAVLRGADLQDREKRLDYMRREMANMQLAFDEWKRLSISVGVALCEEGDRTSADVLERARDLMLENKRAGNEGL